MRIWIFLMLLLVSAVAAQQQEAVIVNITESGKVTSYFDEYWVVNVQGTMTIYNPYNTSFDYLRFPINLGTLTMYEDNATDILKQTEIYVNFLEAQETVIAEYIIRGVSAYDPMEGNVSVLRNSIISDKASLYTFMSSHIQKSEIENESLLTKEIKKREKRRLVVVTLENPSPLAQNVSLIRVLKTPAQDPNNELREWSFPGPIRIEPKSIWTQDILDENSTEGEVYWLSTEANTEAVPIFVSDHIINRFTQEDLYRVENGSIDQSELLENITSYLEHLMYMKKSVSDTVLVPGETVSVTVKVNNFAPISRYVNLTETIPSGFEIISSGDANTSVLRTLKWYDKINPDTSRLFKYDLEFVDNDTIGLDYFEAAVLTYENETLYSERIPFIRQYIPEKKIFVQKKLRYSLSDEIVVQIQIQNLGESKITNLYVREFLGSNDVFREISKAPESKGRWLIPELKRNEIWEVTYVTNENKAVNLLPEVYGVDKKIVLKTLVFENIVRNEWITPAIRAVEIIAPLFILGFIVFYFVYQRRVYSGKVLNFMVLGKKIKQLRKKTELSPKERIELLQRESKTKKDIPSVGAPHAPPTKDKMRDMAHDNIERLKDLEGNTKTEK